MDSSNNNKKLEPSSSVEELPRELCSLIGVEGDAILQRIVAGFKKAVPKGSTKEAEISYAEEFIRSLIDKVAIGFLSQAETRNNSYSVELVARKKPAVVHLIEGGKLLEKAREKGKKNKATGSLVLKDSEGKFLRKDKEWEKIRLVLEDARTDQDDKFSLLIFSPPKSTVAAFEINFDDVVNMTLVHEDDHPLLCIEMEDGEHKFKISNSKNMAKLCCECFNKVRLSVDAFRDWSVLETNSSSNRGPASTSPLPSLENGTCSPLLEREISKATVLVEEVAQLEKKISSLEQELDEYKEKEIEYQTTIEEVRRFSAIRESKYENELKNERCKLQMIIEQIRSNEPRRSPSDDNYDDIRRGRYSRGQNASFTTQFTDELLSPDGSDQSAFFSHDLSRPKSRSLETAPSPSLYDEVDSRRSPSTIYSTISPSPSHLSPSPSHLSPSLQNASPSPNRTPLAAPVPSEPFQPLGTSMSRGTLKKDTLLLPGTSAPPPPKPVLPIGDPHNNNMANNNNMMSFELNPGGQVGGNDLPIINYPTPKREPSFSQPPLDNPDLDKELLNYPWFHPELKREDGERLVIDASVHGAFLLRKSNTDYALVMNWNNTPRNVKVKVTSFGCTISDIRFASIPQMIDFYKSHPFEGMQGAQQQEVDRNFRLVLPIPNAAFYAAMNKPPLRATPPNSPPQSPKFVQQQPSTLQRQPINQLMPRTQSEPISSSHVFEEAVPSMGQTVGRRRSRSDDFLESQIRKLDLWQTQQTNDELLESNPRRMTHHGGRTSSRLTGAPQQLQHLAGLEENRRSTMMLGTDANNNRLRENPPSSSRSSSNLRLRMRGREQVVEMAGNGDSPSSFVEILNEERERAMQGFLESQERDRNGTAQVITQSNIYQVI